MNEFKNKTALITGAGSGIGRATAVLMAKQDIRIAAVDRYADELADLMDEIGGRTGKAFSIVGDPADPDTITESLRQIKDLYGRLDVLFANATVESAWSPVDNLDPEEFRKIVDVNLSATFMAIKYAIPLLRVSEGAVVVTSSIQGTRIFSPAGSTAFSVASAGQVALTKILARELAKDNIRVNVICPGTVDTEKAVQPLSSAHDMSSAHHMRGTHHMSDAMKKTRLETDFPEGRVPLTRNNPATSEQVANLVLFLASPQANHITGTEIYIDGAESLINDRAGVEAESFAVK